MISVSCPDCGKGYKLKPTLIGKTAKCKVCDSSFKIEDPAVESIEDDGNEYAVTMEAPKRPAASPQRKPAKPEPEPVPEEDDQFAGLNSVSSDGATVNDRPARRKRVSTDDDDDDDEPVRSKPKPKPKKKAVKSSSGGGLIQFGGVLSACVAATVGGAIGAVIWGAIAYFTHHEVGYVAWGVGGLVGFCVKMASEEMDETFAGIIAAIGSVVSIMAGKLLAAIFMVQWFIQQGKVPGGLPAEIQGQMVGMAFAASFGVLDIVFFVLAIATAYRLGSGQVGE